MTWRNDPDKGAVPHVGDGAVDCGRRNCVGQAFQWNGKDNDALIAFLGDSAITSVEGKLYRKTAEGQLLPLAEIPVPSIIFKPMAGDWYAISDHEFKTEFAIHVNVAAPKLHGAKQPAAKKAPAKKAATKKAAVAK